MPSSDNLLNDAQIAWVIAARVMLIPSRKTYRDAGRIAIGHRLLGECVRTGLVSETQIRNIHESLRTSISSPVWGKNDHIGKEHICSFYIFCNQRIRPPPQPLKEND